MITNDTTCRNIGDTIIFQSVPMEHIGALNGYTDVTEGEVPGVRFFKRLFQYSIDAGVRFSDWLVLTNENLQTLNGILPTNRHQLVLKFMYQRAGDDNTGLLTLNSISIDGTQLDRFSAFNIGAKSPWRESLIDNVDTLNLMANLASKMYAEGIVPAYLQRGEADTPFEDEDYIDFWQSVAYCYAAFILDAYKFENIYWRRPLLCDYLKQRNIQLCDCNDIIQMQLIAQSYYAEIHSRGSDEIFKPKGHEYPAGYRFAYAMPPNYEIKPATPVQVDGVAYAELSTLPHGWSQQGVTLVAPEKNYHKVMYYNPDTGKFDIPPLVKTLLFPTRKGGVFKSYHGEYLRLICFNQECDEFIYNNVPRKFAGWHLGTSSPIYRGLRPQRGNSLLKAYEKQANVQDLSLYPLINPQNIFVGITNNPYGAEDTVMYISSDGSPCYTNVLPRLLNVSKRLEININIKPGVALEGLITITNQLDNEAFQVPVTSDGSGLITVATDLVPGRYNVELELSFAGTLAGYVGDGANLEYEVKVINGTGFAALYNLEEVGTELILINLNCIK